MQHLKDIESKLEMQISPESQAKVVGFATETLKLRPNPILFK